MCLFLEQIVRVLLKIQNANFALHSFAPPGCILRHLAKREMGGYACFKSEFQNTSLSPDEKKAVKAEL